MCILQRVPKQVVYSGQRWQRAEAWKGAANPEARKSVQLQDTRSARRLVSQEARNGCSAINMSKPGRSLQDTRSARHLLSQATRNGCSAINMSKARRRLVERWDGRQVRRVLQDQEDQVGVALGTVHAPGNLGPPHRTNPIQPPFRTASSQGGSSSSQRADGGVRTTPLHDTVDPMLPPLGNPIKCHEEFSTSICLRRL